MKYDNYSEVKMEQKAILDDKCEIAHVKIAEGGPVTMPGRYFVNFDGTETIEGKSVAVLSIFDKNIYDCLNSNYYYCFKMHHLREYTIREGEYIYFKPLKGESYYIKNYGIYFDKIQRAYLYKNFYGIEKIQGAPLLDLIKPEKKLFTDLTIMKCNEKISFF